MRPHLICVWKFLPEKGKGVAKFKRHQVFIITIIPSLTDAWEQLMPLGYRVWQISSGNINHLFPNLIVYIISQGDLGNSSSYKWGTQNTNFYSPPFLPQNMDAGV